jgi:hypothetical protein
LPTGIGASLSGDVGYWQLGTSDAFYAVPAFPGGVPYTSYLTWDVGLTFAWKALALDLRYYDTNLTKAECNVFTSDQTATFSPGSVTPQNPSGRLRLVWRHLHRQAVDCHHDQRYQMRIPQLFCAVAIGSSEIVAAMMLCAPAAQPGSPKWPSAQFPPCAARRKANKMASGSYRDAFRFVTSSVAGK